MTNMLVHLLEDDPLQAELARRAARSAFKEVRVVHLSTGADLHAALARETPTVILMDIRLDNESGLDVLREIRANERGARLPVVMMITSSEPSDVEASYARGANAYVCKPVDYDAFRTVMRSVLEFWLAFNVRAQP